MSKSPSPRGRPSAERMAQIERGILSSALDLFIDAGYDSTSMEAIAAHANISKGTLYARYSGKEALFRAILRGEIDRWSERAGAQDHLRPTEPEARLRSHARTLMHVFSWPDFQQVSQLLDSVSPLFPDLIQEWQQIGTGDYLDFLASDLAAAADVDGRAPQDWRLIGSVLLHSLTGWYRAESRLGEMTEDKAEDYADRVSELLGRGIARPASK